MVDLCAHFPRLLCYLGIGMSTYLIIIWMVQLPKVERCGKFPWEYSWEMEVRIVYLNMGKSYAYCMTV